MNRPRWRWRTPALFRSMAGRIFVLLPVGIVTSMIGVPVFLALVLRRPERT